MRVLKKQDAKYRKKCGTMDNIVNWVLDKDLFSDYTDNLVAAITSSGMKVHIFDEYKETSFGSFMYKKFKSQPVILHGSLQQGNFINKSNFYPGVYLNLDRYECFKYYGYFGEDLLNSNYFMMGLNDLHRNYRKIFRTFEMDKIFIRPSNGYKSFPGQILPFSNFEFELDVLKKSYGGLDIDQLVVVSPYKDIIDEWRFIVVNDEVITGSLYMNEDSRKTNTPIFDKPCGLFEPAAMFAKYLAKLYSPDKAYTIDVCSDEDGFHLLELNSFCCANMYGADLDKVVKAVNHLVISDYKDVLCEPDYSDH